MKATRPARGWSRHIVQGQWQQRAACALCTSLRLTCTAPCCAVSASCVAVRLASCDATLSSRACAGRGGDKGCVCL